MKVLLGANCSQYTILRMSQTVHIFSTVIKRTRFEMKNSHKNMFLLQRFYSSSAAIRFLRESLSFKRTNILSKVEWAYNTLIERRTNNEHAPNETSLSLSLRQGSENRKDMIRIHTKRNRQRTH